VGELCVKGPNIFKGYLNNQAATENTFTPDGVLKTGDIGYQDRQGNVYITDRIKEMIKYKGFPIAPAELEGVLVSHSKIVDAGVVGVYDEQQTTELPRAYVVVYPGVPQDDTTAYEISKWMEKRVAHHKFLRGGVKFVDEIPKNPAGKILRTALRARAKAEGVARPKSKI
jgi:4-coumarate--CoA ligase